jgi:hypothetical protein
MINCIQEDDGSLTITWDQNDPVESILNTWTEQDFIDAIMERCDRPETVTIPAQQGEGAPTISTTTQNP